MLLILISLQQLVSACGGSLESGRSCIGCIDSKTEKRIPNSFKVGFADGICGGLIVGIAGGATLFFSPATFAGGTFIIPAIIGLSISGSSIAAWSLYEAIKADKKKNKKEKLKTVAE